MRVWLPFLEMAMWQSKMATTVSFWICLGVNWRERRSWKWHHHIKWHSRNFLQSLWYTQYPPSHSYSATPLSEQRALQNSGSNFADITRTLCSCPQPSCWLPGLTWEPHLWTTSQNTTHQPHKAALYTSCFLPPAWNVKKCSQALSKLQYVANRLHSVL